MVPSQSQLFGLWTEQWRPKRPSLDMLDIHHWNMLWAMGGYEAAAGVCTSKPSFLPLLSSPPACLLLRTRFCSFCAGARKGKELAFFAPLFAGTTRTARYLLVATVNPNRQRRRLSGTRTQAVWVGVSTSKEAVMTVLIWSRASAQRPHFGF